MTAESGAAIFALNQADLDISHSQFTRCNSTNDGGIIKLDSSNISMISSTIDQFNGGAIHCEYGEYIELEDVIMQNGIS